MVLKHLAALWGLMLVASLGVATAAKATGATPRSKNGVRMVGTSGLHGRLEVSTTDPLFPGLNESSKATWVPVCASGFTDGQAETVCKIMGYTYGRMYNVQRVVSPPKPVTGYTARLLTCTPPYDGRRHRRHLRAASAGPAEIAASSAVAVASALGAEPGSDLGPESGSHRGSELGSNFGSGSGLRHPLARERSLAYRFFNVAIPPKVPYICRFLLGNCAPNGPFAGIECSRTPLPNAPPPPPSPPKPPRYSEYIRLVGGDNRDLAEPNLCASPEFCQKFSRVEVRVPAPDGADGSIWAPLCAAESASLRSTIAMVACQQAYDWPALKPTPPVLLFSRTPIAAPFGFTLPRGPVNASAGDFDPTAHRGWATISALKGIEPSMLQDGNLTVSASPCESLFALTCLTLYAR